MAAYVEAAAGWLFASCRGRDDKLFTTLPAFAAQPSATVRISSPDCGPSGARLDKQYMHGGPGRLPQLEWDPVEGAEEWLLLSEDPDAPLPTPICHGSYLGIPKDRLRVENDDFQLDKEGATRLKGGFFHGQNRQGNVYIPPRPLINHGSHRYFFEIIALSEPLDRGFVASSPTREQIGRAIDGKVLAWGRWIGECERKWEQRG